jgi:putative hydrolase of the HAD superfamily
MSEQKVVVFDLGKVLVDFDYSIAIRRFAERSKAGLEQIQRLLDSPIQIDYESGKITTDEFYAAIRDGAGFRGDRAEFVSIFADIFSPMETMIEFFERLKPFGIPTCVFPTPTKLRSDTSAKGFRFTVCLTITCCRSRKAA